MREVFSFVGVYCFLFSLDEITHPLNGSNCYGVHKTRAPIFCIGTRVFYTSTVSLRSSQMGRGAMAASARPFTCT